VFGVAGLDRFYGFSIVKDLQVWVTNLKVLIKQERGKISQLVTAFTKKASPVENMPNQPGLLYADLLKNFSSPHVDLVILGVALIGQKQILRRQIANIINFRCKMESNPLFSALEALNQSLLNDIRAHYRDPDNKPYPESDNPLLSEVSSYLSYAGMSDPFSKLYITPDASDLELPSLFFVLLLKQLPRFAFEAHLSLRPSSKKETIDEAPFVVGFLTILRQFHPDIMFKFLAYVGQYIRSSVDEHIEKIPKASDYTPDVIKMLLFIEMFVYFGRIEPDVISEFIPEFIWTNFHK
jgi:WASH complex subunit strumpellin